MRTTETITTEFNTMNRIPMFEIEVLNTIDNEIEYITYNIAIEGDKLVCQYTSIEIEIDEDFSLDEHLQELYNECIEDICNTDHLILHS
jgi:hypothetical protein